MSEALHKALLERVVRLPTDYKIYGGTVERWSDPALSYPDCSAGCRHFAKLDGKLGSDWGVCTRLDGPRFSLLTFEHQAGFGCYERAPDEPDWMEEMREVGTAMGSTEKPSKDFGS